MARAISAYLKSNLPDLFETGLEPEAGSRRWIGNLHGMAAATIITGLASGKQSRSALTLWIARDQSQLARLEQELRFCGMTVTVFPDWETLPYDRLSPHQAITSERLAILSNMPTQGILLLTVSTLAHRLAPPQWLLGQHFNMRKGQKLAVETERERLTRAGYRHVETVFEPGEYAVRGSLFDIFPMGQTQPVRIDLFDDEVDSIRHFDPETQRTTGQIDEFVILPAQEFPLVEGRGTFRERFAEAFDEISPRRVTLYQDVVNGLAPPGIEYYLPLFFDHDSMQEQGSLFDYLPENVLVVMEQEAEPALTQFWQDTQHRYEERRHDQAHPVLPPDWLFLPVNELFSRLKNYPRLVVSEQLLALKAGVVNVPAQSPPVWPIDRRDEQPLRQFTDWLGNFLGTDTAKAEKADSGPARVLIVADSAGRREALQEWLQKTQGTLPRFNSLPDFLDSKSPVGLAIAAHGDSQAYGLSRGLLLEPEAGTRLAVIAESQLLGQRVEQARRQRDRQPVSEEFLVQSLSELSIGAPVVHVDHGVGRFGGLVKLTLDGQEQEFLQINYAGNDRIYTPVASLQLVSRYSAGDPDDAPLHKIGSDAWNKAKRKAFEQINDVAAELLNIQARRAAKPGQALTVDEAQYALFASQFAFEETIDQANAITATLYDMAQLKPMDRLICGDVGFGKTEVAMRAAFVAVMNGKQVAILAPTTLLAQQHYDNFRDRFADWPVRIEVLSRFGSRKDQARAISDMAEGKVDIVIGTHKLIQEGIQFRDLGLMIIDEEHRFGVRDKERIKAMRTDVDTLTLTATPIPRTLNMAFGGMRDLSVIATPPARRLAVKTLVMEHTNPVLKEAMLRELLRGGQVYYLHNDVDSIERTAEELRRLLPEARVAVAHGQMRERELERVMQNFYHQDYNVLVCSTIIETGIDVPNANTIIIDRADKLGLAQLHQLRGRVGRSHHQAYAYLLVPSIKHLKGDAEKRLEAIARASALGAGFILATEDLEIRGAGDILGEAQSGTMHAVGFSLYMDMLAKATRDIQNHRVPNLNAPLNLTADINLHLAALIPDDYLGDVNQRLLLYKRISHAADQAALDELKREMIDRFGLLPVPVQNLFAVHRLRLLAERLGIARIDVAAGGGVLEFNTDTPVDGMQIIQLIQQQPTHYRMDGGQRLKILLRQPEPASRLAWLQQLLDKLLSGLPAAA